MIWLGTFGCAVLFGALAWVPTGWSSGCAAQLAQQFERAPGSDPVRVSTEADPLLELPAGYIRRLRIQMPGVLVAGIPIRECALSLSPVRLPVASAWGLEPPRLLVPSLVEARLVVDESDVLGALETRVAERAWPVLPMMRMGHLRLGGAITFERPQVTFQNDRVVLAATVVDRGLRRRIAFSAMPGVDEAGRLRFDAPRLTLDGVVVPAVLYRAALAQMAAGWGTSLRWRRVIAFDGRLELGFATMLATQS